MEENLPPGRHWLRASGLARGMSRQHGPGARFATDRELLSPAWSYMPKDRTLLLGHHAGALIGLANDDRHALTVAGTRGGKGISLIVPNTVLWPGSMLVLDPKGELARMTARARRQIHGQETVIIDPFGVSGQPSTSCNLLDGIDLTSPHAVPAINMLTDSLIIPSSTSSGGDHFAEAARELLKALIVYAKIHFPRPTLNTVYDLLGGRYGPIAGSLKEPPDILQMMLDSPEHHSVLRAMAIRWLEIPHREQGSILSTARTQLAWLEGLNNPDAAMVKACQPSRFSLPDLKRKDVTLYLCLPASYMHAYRGWLRAFVNLAMVALEITPRRPGVPAVLMLLDEFATLGHMPALEKAAGLLAGCGVKLWPIVQDLGQLESIYGKRWGTFIANAGVTTWFALGGDALTADYLSKRLGSTQYYEPDDSHSGPFTSRVAAGNLHGNGGKWVNSPLMYPHELERILARENGLLLALTAGQPPAFLHRNNILNGFLGEWIDD